VTRRKTWIIRSAVALGVVAAIGVGYMELMKAGFIRYNRFDRRDRGTLRKGDAVPDLAVTLYEGGSLTLSSLWNQKPVFLVFGSCT
jgi:hypothetical protein